MSSFIKPETQITLQQFIGVKNSQGLFKTYTEIVDGMYQQIINNTEVLDATIIKPEEIIGDNITFSNIALPKVSNFESDITKFDANTPVLDKLVMKLTNDFSVGYEYDFRDERSAKDWASKIGEWTSGAYTGRSDMNNYLSMEALINMCLVTGQYTILPELDYINVSDKNGNNNWVYNNNTAIVTDEINKIVTKRTPYGLGKPQEKMRVYYSYRSFMNITRGVNYISTANLSLEAYKSGNFNEVLGFPSQKTMYLGKDNIVGVDPTNKVRDFKFGKVLSMVYSMESLAFYAKTYKILPDWQKPGSIGKHYWCYAWRANACVKNTFAPFNRVILKEAPTAVEINSILTSMKAEQPGFYPYLPDVISAEQVQMWNFENDRSYFKVLPEQVAIAYVGEKAEVKLGKTLQMLAKVQPADAPQGISWTSGTPSIATIDANGLVTGVAAGDVEITATSTADNTKSAKLTIKVVA